METWKNRHHFHWNNPHRVDPCLDPTNSFLCCHPMAANICHTTFSQEPNIYPPDAPEPKIWKDEWNHEFVADKNGDCEFPVNEMKTIEAMACKIPAPPCFPSPEEQLSADVSGSEKSLKAGEIGDGSKKRKIRKSEKGPLCVFKTRSESNTVEDGYKWKKYGTKILKSKPHPRSYYRCMESSCNVKKRVEREATDPRLLVTTYEGIHNHESPSVIYYIGKPIILPQLAGSKPVIILVNPGVGAEAVMKFVSQ
eukprot:PITA_20012